MYASVQLEVGPTTQCIQVLALQLLPVFLSVRLAIVMGLPLTRLVAVDMSVEEQSLDRRQVGDMLPCHIAGVGTWYSKASDHGILDREWIAVAYSEATICC